MGYTSPLEDTKFVLENLLPAHEDLDDTTIDAVLSEAGKLADNYLAPLNHFGDKNNPILRQDHEVETPEGFSHAFSEIAKGGWIGVASDSNYDGMGLPARMSAAINEYWHGANMSFALCSLLTQGLIDAFTLVGTEEEKKTYLPKFNSGAWTGTMNLTEPQSGTDLATIKTKAEHDGENWRIKGQKIYITYGEHDMSENIIHLVLARTEGAPEGIKGISTFIIPKFLKDESGEYTIRNDLKCISIEHKMGIKASPTAVMSYGENEGAIGYMLGEEGRGIEYMFIMMNRARFDVGLQGMAISEAARQKALEYANTRIQGTPINREKGKKQFSDIAQNLLNKENPDIHNQAIMEFGSQICKPKKPNCTNCPLNSKCIAYINSSINTLPVKNKKIKLKTQYFEYFYFKMNGYTLIKKRTEKGIWQNMYEFPLIICEKFMKNENVLNHNQFQLWIDNIDFNLDSISVFKHVLSHKKINVRFWEINCLNELPKYNFKKIKIDEIDKIPIPRIIEKFIENKV